MWLNDDSSFEDLTKAYERFYSLHYLNPPTKDGQSSFERKLVLISLICYVTSKTKLKSPDTTYYSVIAKLANGSHIPDQWLKGLAVVCEDFAYGCTDFPTFGLKGQDILKEIVEILKSWLPF